MASMYLILGLALGGAAFAVLAFIWSVRSGQLDDLDTPPRRALLDEGTVSTSSTTARDELP